MAHLFFRFSKLTRKKFVFFSFQKKELQNACNIKEYRYRSQSVVVDVLDPQLVKIT